MATPSILIAGTGAMACLFGARLAPHAEVTLLGTWSDGLAALQRGGIRLEAGGLETAYRVRATSDPLDCAGAPFALVLVKSWQTRRTAETLAQCLASDGVALTLQNGLGNLESLQEVLGPGRAALGVTTTGATLLGPATVRPGGSGPTYVGRHPRIEPYLAVLAQAGFAIEMEEDLEALLWGKLVVNTAINPLTALLQVVNGELVKDPHARRLLRAVAMETASVAVARGIRLPYADPIAQTEAVAERTGSNRSSMLQDIQRGAPTEIDAINGAVARAGEAVGVEAPLNNALWALVRAQVDLHASRTT
jgi:2-dehydropantoate 2-reductase